MNSISQPSHKKIAIIVLILTTILWGTTFIITKTVTKEVPVFLYLGLRFSIALLGITPFIIRFNKKINKKIIWMGTFSGIIYYISIAFQTIGLQSTSAGKTAFITGLNCVMVPFLAWMIFKKKELNKRIWIAVGLSVIGMAFLLLEGDEETLIGDILVLICAICFAIFIVFNDKYVKLVDVYLYSFIQLLVISLLCFGSSMLFNESYHIMSANINFWLIMCYMGFIATTLTFIFQNWGQKHQGPSQTAIIFTLEPVFAVLFASYIIGNEVLSWQAWIGCGLIFIAILITILKYEQFKENNEDNFYNSPQNSLS